MSRLRRMPLPRLLGLCVAMVVLGATATALADTLSSGPTPPRASLAEALHRALSAPSVSGVSANIELTNHLLEVPNVEGLGGDGGPDASDPLLAGGSGRLWISDSGKLRLELQSQSGDTELVDDGSTVSIYDAATDSLYRFKLPPRQAGSSGPTGSTGTTSTGTTSGGSGEEVPSVEAIERVLTKLAGRLDLSAAIPTDVAGQPAYAVRLSPAGGGGLLESVELAFDAAHGLPLKLAVYAKGSPSSAVLELKVTAISFAPIAESTFELEPPANAKVTEVNLGDGDSGGGLAEPGSAEAGMGATGPGTGTTGPPTSPSGSAAVAAALPFTLEDPAEVDDLARSQVKLVHVGGKPAALITYGSGLGAIAVIESQAQSSSPGSAPSAGSGAPSAGSGAQAAGEGPESLLANLPTVSIDGSTATELPTALGTIISFQRSGVSYLLAGSVTAASARAAAEDLLS